MSGCASAVETGNIAMQPPALRGAVRGGQQPVAGAAIQLFAVGSTGDGSAATPLLNRPVASASDGSFTLTGLFRCPSAGTLVYLLATGGNAGIGGTNASLALMSAIGTCGSLSSTSFLAIDEVTTVAAVMPLAAGGFLSAPNAVGAAPATAPHLAAAFATAGQLASAASGTSPGGAIPAGTQVPVAEVNTLANLIAACVNSAGGVPGDGSICGNLFALEAVPGLVTPHDTVSLLARIALEPSANTAALFASLPAQPVFAPALTAAPASFALHLAVSAGVVAAPDALAFASAYVDGVSASQAVSFTNSAGQTIALGAPSLAGADAAEFTLSTDCLGTLAPQAACTVWMGFSPAVSGIRVAALDLIVANGQNLFLPLMGSALANPPATLSTALNASTVFLGASIVQLWPLPLHNAGIYGQTTPQMLARFAQDVLGHGYTHVVILGGSNDITGGLSLQSVTLPDLAAMGRMAQNAGLEVILSQLPPITLNGISYNQQVEATDAAIRQLATEQGWLCVDYFTPMSGHPEYFVDGEHPNGLGYAVMEAALARNLIR